MYCKYCGTELEKNKTVCSACGRDTADKPRRAKKQHKELTAKQLKIIIASIAASLVVIAFVVMAICGVFTPKEGVFLKDNYSVSASEAEANADKIIATCGDMKLTNGQLQVFYWMEAYDFISNNYEYLSYYGLDTSKALSEQESVEEGMTWEQYFLNEAVYNWQAYASLVQASEKEAFELPEDVKAEIAGMREDMEQTAKDNKMDSVEALLASEMGPGVSYEDFEYQLTVSSTANRFFATKLSALTATMEEMESYFTEYEDMLKNDLKITKESGDVVSVRHILVKPVGGQTIAGETVYSQEQWDKAENVAKVVLDKWLAGEKTAESFGALAEKHSEDPGSVSKGGLYEGVAKGQMVEAFDEWIFAEGRKTGDYGLVKTELGWHVMYYVDSEPQWIYTCRSAVINKKGTEMMASFMEQYPVEVDFESVTMGEHIIKK